MYCSTVHYITFLFFDKSDPFLFVACEATYRFLKSGILSSTTEHKPIRQTEEVLRKPIKKRK